MLKLRKMASLDGQCGSHIPADRVTFGALAVARRFRFCQPLCSTLSAITIIPTADRKLTDIKPGRVFWKGPLRRASMAENNERVNATPMVMVAHRSSPKAPTGAGVWVPMTSVVESETLMEQPVTVSRSVMEEVVVPSET